MRQGAQGWCTGMTQRDGMGREMGGGFRMGNTCAPMANSCQCMAKLLQYCKVLTLQLIFFFFNAKDPEILEKRQSCETKIWGMKKSVG